VFLLLWVDISDICGQTSLAQQRAASGMSTKFFDRYVIVSWHSSQHGAALYAGKTTEIVYCRSSLFRGEDWSTCCGLIFRGTYVVLAQTLWHQAIIQRNSSFCLSFV
jgi:hypothetical protein